MMDRRGFLTVPCHDKPFPGRGSDWADCVKKRDPRSDVSGNAKMRETVAPD
jgi:hypothetical protein